MLSFFYKLFRISRDIKRIYPSKPGELLYPGLYWITENHKDKIDGELSIAGFLKKEYYENQKDYDENGLPVNDDYGLLQKRFKDYLIGSSMYQPRRIFKERVL